MNLSNDFSEKKQIFERIVFSWLIHEECWQIDKSSSQFYDKHRKTISTKTINGLFLDVNIMSNFYFNN